MAKKVVKKQAKSGGAKKMTAGEKDLVKRVKAKMTKGEERLAKLKKHKDKEASARAELIKDFVACQDVQGRTCIQVQRDPSGIVRYIPLDLDGFRVDAMTAEQFGARYQPIPGYTPTLACEHYVKYAQDYGATNEAMLWLGKAVNIKPEVIEMATKKLSAKQQTGGATKTGKPRKAGGGGSSKPGSGARIRELIMQKMGTEEILKIIHKEFPGSKAKGSDVNWNKNWLRKNGQTVPEAKGAAKSEAKAAPKKVPAAKAKKAA